MNTESRLGTWPDEPPAPRQLIEVVRMLAKHSALILTDHAEERMHERDIDMRDVLCVLRTGGILGDIEPGINKQEWICKVTASPRYPDNFREIGVVTVVMRDSRLLIQTVEWEDQR